MKYEIENEINLDSLTTAELHAHGQQAVIDALMVPADWLPESYRGKRSKRKLSSVVSQLKRTRKDAMKEDREVSVKFDADRNVTSARPGRLAVLEKYAADVAAGREIGYDVDEPRLARQEMAMYSGLEAAGWFDDDEELETEWVYENDL